MSAHSQTREQLLKNLEWLKLSNKVLRAFPSSPRQKALKVQLEALEQSILRCNHETI